MHYIYRALGYMASIQHFHCLVCSPQKGAAGSFTYALSHLYAGWDEGTCIGGVSLSPNVFASDFTARAALLGTGGCCLVHPCCKVCLS